MHARTSGKSSILRDRFDPLKTLSRPPEDPSSTHRRPLVDPSSTPRRPLVDPLVKEGSSRGLFLINSYKHLIPFIHIAKLVDISIDH